MYLAIACGAMIALLAIYYGITRCEPIRKASRKHLRALRAGLREWSRWLTRSHQDDNQPTTDKTTLNRAQMILSSPRIEKTSNVLLMLDAASRPQPLHEDIIEVRLRLEEELLRPISTRLPANELRNRLKSLAALLKSAAIEERVHVSETLGNLFKICFTTAMVSYLACYLNHFGDNVLPSFDPETFFQAPGSLFSGYSSAFGIVTGLGSTLGSLFLPFGWNLASLLPYAMAISTVSSFARIPIIGSLISRIFYAVLAIRFFWLQLPSMVSAAVYTTFLVLFVGYPMVRARLPRLYIIVPFFLISIGLGYFVMLQDPAVGYIQNPLIQICSSLGLCEGWY